MLIVNWTQALKVVVAELPPVRRAIVEAILSLPPERDHISSPEARRRWGLNRAAYEEELSAALTDLRAAFSDCGLSGIDDLDLDVPEKRMPGT